MKEGKFSHLLPNMLKTGCHKVWDRGTAGARHNIFCEAQNGKMGAYVFLRGENTPFEAKCASL